MGYFRVFLGISGYFRYDIVSYCFNIVLILYQYILRGLGGEEEQKEGRVYRKDRKSGRKEGRKEGRNEGDMKDGRKEERKEGKKERRMYACSCVCYCKTKHATVGQLGCFFLAHWENSDKTSQLA